MIGLFVLVTCIVLFAIYCVAAYVIYQLLKEVEEEGKR